MRLLVLGGFIASLWLLTAFQPRLLLPKRDLTADEVREAIKRGSDFLKSQQEAKGTWPDRRGYAGGLTPLCTLALLHAGYGVGDEAVQKSLVRLREFEPTATYAASLQTMALCAAEPKRDRLLIARNIQFLESRQLKEGPSSGMWAFPVAGTPDHTDNSMTHLAILALHEAERVGFKIDANVWRRTLDYWKRSQNADGSWGWGPEYPGSGSMTCAGIAAILIASGHRDSDAAVIEEDQINCCDDDLSDPSVERALDWLSHNFTVHRNPGMVWWLTYYLYSLERAGRMTGQRYIGRHDWYREAAWMLIDKQLQTGAWPSDLDDEYLGDPIVSTSFAVMFLAKARRPVLLAHLKHAPHDDWNHHSRGVFNLVGYVEAAWNRELAHEVIDIAAASVEELLEAPVLLISGREAPRFTDEEKRKLRMYVDRGGFIFGQPSCGNSDFDEGFRKLMADIFPEPDSKLHLLNVDHPVWRSEERVNPQYLRELWGVESSCRTCVIYCPQDLACYWNLSQVGREKEYSESAQAQIQAARAIGANILAYATNRDLKFKDPALASIEVKQPVAARGAFTLAHVLHPGGCDATPAALRNLLRLVSKDLKLSVSSEPREVRLGDPELLQCPLAWMQGRQAFQLTALERTRLRTYLQRGGTLFADAICSSPEFSESFRREMKAIFPEQSLEPIPTTDRLFSAEFGGEKIEKVMLREPSKTPGEPPAVHAVPPLLEGLRVGDHYAVIFSPYDISCSLEGHANPECSGYSREDAGRIAVHVVLYSMH